MTASNVILEFVYEHPVLNKRIVRLVPADLVDDMRIHLIEILAKMNYDKLFKLYDRDELIKYTMRILHTQLSPKCNNCFHQLYYPKIYRGSPEYNDNLNDKYETFNYELENIGVYGVNNKVLQEVMGYIRHIEPHKYVIFEKSYIEGYSNKEISIMTKVHIQTIINWKTQLLKEIRNYLQRNGFIINSN